MTAQPKRRAPASIRTLWAIAKSPELSLSDEELYALVLWETGKESLKKLTQGELNAIAKILQTMKDSTKHEAQVKRRIDERGNDYTKSQRRKIYALCELLGWNNDPRRLRGFVKRMTHVDRVEWLSASQCSQVIEGLKEMIARKEQKEAVDVRPKK